MNKKFQAREKEGLKDTDKLYQHLYPQIKKIAYLQIAKLRPGQTITPTVLSHECFIKLSKFKTTEFISDKHFFCTVAKCMRNYLIDVIRHKNREKNVIEFDFINASLIPDHNNIDDQLLEINHLIDQLADIDKDLAELTELRFFLGAFLWKKLLNSKVFQNAKWFDIGTWLNHFLSL